MSFLQTSMTKGPTEQFFTFLLPPPRRQNYPLPWHPRTVHFSLSFGLKGDLVPVRGWQQTPSSPLSYLHFSGAQEPFSLFYFLHNFLSFQDLSLNVWNCSTLGSHKSRVNKETGQIYTTEWWRVLYTGVNLEDINITCFLTVETNNTLIWANMIVVQVYGTQRYDVYFFFPLGYSWGTEYPTGTIFLKAEFVVVLFIAVSPGSNTVPGTP